MSTAAMIANSQRRTVTLKRDTQTASSVGVADFRNYFAPQIHKIFGRQPLSSLELLPCPNGLPLELQHVREIPDRKLRVMPPRIDVELIWDAARVEQLV